MVELAYLNGEILPLDNAFVPIEDRGYQFGDGVYEVISFSGGRLFALEPHLVRLKGSMSELDFPEMSMEKIRKEIIRFVLKSGLSQGMLYLQISRGVKKRAHPVPKEINPQFVMTARELPPPPTEDNPKGIKVITTPDIRWGRCDIKTILLLPNSLAKQKALDKGAYDAIFVSDNNMVREATSSNVMVYKDKQVITHPLTNNILPGITRAIVLDLCEKTGIPYQEQLFTVDELLKADEVFLTGTITRILPVTTVNDTVVGSGAAGKMTRKISSLLTELMK